MKLVSSSGGLATGLKSYHKANNSLWIGWPGLSARDEEEETEITELLKSEDCLPVFLERKLFRDFYDGFSNGTLWPLFHYFTEYTLFNKNHWEAYQKVNELFAEAVIGQAEENDQVWIHDYQLMLLPAILRERRPDLRIGFFLHIPFPSYEVFRILPWREKIVEGLLGADLIGFHTYDYARHFVSSVKRLLGYDVEFTRIKLSNRHVHYDVFPMGIDYKKFSEKAKEIQQRSVSERSKHHRDLDLFLKGEEGRKIILSIDRLDYTKGIPLRIKGIQSLFSGTPGVLG